MTPDHGFREYSGRRVTVMGLGSFGGGLGAVRFLVERGALVTVTDLRPAAQLAEAIAELQAAPPSRWHLGRHDEADFIETDLVIVNPAIRRDHPLLRSALSRGVPLSSEMNLFWQHQRGQIIGVTGSNGKSTTAALMHSILKQTNRRAWLGGNIGRSLLPNVAEIQSGDLVVLELSSFQLTDLDRLRVSPWISVVTNFSPNHLDWHDTVDHYRWAKQTLLRWQSDDGIAVLNADDPEVRQWSAPGRRLLFGWEDHGGDGIFTQGDQAIWREGTRAQAFPLGEWLKLPGRHNLLNALAATTAAQAAGANGDAVRRGIESYEPLPHRLEFVGEVAGRKFYNDSLATTPESAIVGLDAFAEPVILLAGGYDKQVDLAGMARHIAARAKAVALMGQTGPALRDLIADSDSSRVIASEPLPDFRTAFDWAWEHSARGDVILLSPGCASYDWFRNFADRGRQFRALTRELAGANE